MERLMFRVVVQLKTVVQQNRIELKKQNIIFILLLLLNKYY